MRIVAGFIALLLSADLTAAQVPDTIMVPMTGQERAVIMSMCDHALWANRRAFEGTCEFFKVKFDTVEKAKAAADAKPAEPDKPKE